ncbi:hypothetical protein [Fervidibacillus halotolerans]|uniref:Uncharacterized protein n=1 Tax=Fervidibacillus halotolerans TaxID=2980027 RepID=A0A9E8LZI9_9BACI|nr:hypothetical protein [Fervidibacillus halotolerans]WAA12454.1 hypothetical protein OE105_13140 [Fervidibacillus halotolerans]
MDGNELTIYDIEDALPSALAQLIKNNVMLVGGMDKSYLIDSSCLSVLLRGQIQTGLAENLLFVEDVTDIDEDESKAKSGTFFDCNGKKVSNDSKLMCFWISVFLYVDNKKILLKMR